jgi:hypothetical protein
MSELPKTHTINVSEIPALSKNYSHMTFKHICNIKSIKIKLLEDLVKNINDPSKIFLTGFFEDFDNDLMRYNNFDITTLKNPLSLEIILGTVMILLKVSTNLELHSFIDQAICNIIKKHHKMINPGYIFEIPQLSFIKLMILTDMTISFEYCLQNFEVKLFTNSFDIELHKKIQKKDKTPVEKKACVKWEELYNKLYKNVYSMISIEYFKMSDKMNHLEETLKRLETLELENQTLKAQLKTTLESIETIANNVDVKSTDIKDSDVYPDGFNIIDRNLI